ncbi:MAG: phosphoglucosamine mutase [Capsulimonadaceae bacterium]|nr:phosphoglucosamine mutase [Capsulimonadaceae bacterium]
MSHRLFGTDGVRGVANTELTPMLAMRLGLAAGSYFGRGKEHPVFVVGGDSRLSGPMLESALASGLSATGVRVLAPGLLPTPAVACITREIGADAGVVISASHNPFQDNGIKFFGPDGFKLEDAIEDELEELVKKAFDLPRPAGAGVGQIRREPSLTDYYARHVEETIRPVSLEGLKVVIDGANGAASELAPRIFADLGATVVSMNCIPNGININHNCGALHPEAMQECVRLEGADVGIALDGDADRLILSDENGCNVDGDRVMGIVGMDMAERGELAGGAVVATVMSNMGLEVALRRKGIALVRTNVGDRYVSERMRRDGYVIGGEKSGHLIFGNLTTTGDGIVTALQILKVMRRTGKKLSSLASFMTEYPQLLVNIRVTDRQAWEKDVDFQRVVAEAEKLLEGEGRINVRASGTEKLLRVMVEAPDPDQVRSLAERVAGVAREKWGV